VLAEGKNREIRRVLARVGHKVLQLKRIAIGPVRLGELPEGAYRELTVAEVKALKRLTSEPSAP
ncbi:MAG: pseudouridine synthase, partial [Planctomycetota bacterium]|nr:pseudouridine synthase [Planctomycetota bacterium]